MTYDRAIELLRKSKTLRVFAPTGLWLKNKAKRDWIQAICSSLADREIVYGDGTSVMQKVVVGVRAKKLSEAGVKLFKYPQQRQSHLGFIIFDDIALVGLKDNIVEITNKVELKILRDGFEEAKNDRTA